MNISAALDGNAFMASRNFPLEGETKPWRGGFSNSIKSAVSEGLTFRRIERTVTDVYEVDGSTEEWEN